MNGDLIFLSGKFFDVELPKEKRYLLKYFDTPIQKAYLLYVHLFGDSKNFVDHTGLYCGKTYLCNLIKKLEKIQRKHKEAKESMDLEMLVVIETGKFICEKN